MTCGKLHVSDGLSYCSMHASSSSKSTITVVFCSAVNLVAVHPVVEPHAVASAVEWALVTARLACRESFPL